MTGCVLLVTLLCGTAAPDATSARLQFWDRERVWETAALSAEVAADGYTTQVLWHRGVGEINPVARPLVREGWPGQVGASVLGVGVAVGAQFLLHRMGHDKAARWLGRVAVAGEGANVARQGVLMERRGR